MNKQGLTLIELLVSLVILVSLVSAFAFVFKCGKAQLEKAFVLSQATLLLQSEMEKLHLLPFAVLANMSSSHFAEGKGQIEVAPISSDLISIQLNLSYDPSSVPIKLYSLRSSN